MTNWTTKTIDRALQRARSANAGPADRVALLCDVLRRSSGRVELGVADDPLQPGDSGLFGRFGVEALLPAPSGRRAYRSKARSLEHIAAGLDAAVAHDPEIRRVTLPTTSDGAHLRLSDHTSYLNPSHKAAFRAFLSMPPGDNLIASLPTGSGKSLLFQAGIRWLRETVHPRAVGIVVVPTVSLAHAHEETLQQTKALEQSRSITGGDDAEDTLRRFALGEVPLLVVNPETMISDRFASTLEAVTDPHPLSEETARLAAVWIDEAHIIDSWGRTFRPWFQGLAPKIAEMRTRAPDLRTCLLSATISDPAFHRLATDFEKPLVVSARVPRYELTFLARKYESARERDERLDELIDALPRPAIVYTTQPSHAEVIATRLRDRGYFRLATYTGKTARTDKRRIGKQWLDGELDLVIATEAFGMGIDKSDVRAVVHACVPQDAARWYQEVGRGGRDGHSAFGVCLWTEADRKSAKGMVVREGMTPERSAERWLEFLDLLRGQGRIRPAGTGWRVTFPVDIAPRDLGRFTGDKNRRWNRYKINLLQRAGHLRVLGASGEQGDWELEVKTPEVLGKDHAWLEAQFGRRTAEVAEALALHEDFVEVLKEAERGADAKCLLSALFPLIEANYPTPVAEPLWCGRCPMCRAEDLDAPPQPPTAAELVFGGTDVFWPRDISRPVPRFDRSTLLTCASDPTPAVLAAAVVRLARLGFKQFVVQGKALSRDMAIALKALDTHAGLVLSVTEWVEVPWALQPVPTVFVLPERAPTGSRIERALERVHLDNALQTVLIAPPGGTIRGRRLELHLRIQAVRRLDAFIEETA